MPFQTYPSSFEYREIVLEMVDINTLNAESVVFCAYPRVEGVDLLKYVDLIPKDHYFNYLFACIFGLTVLRADVRFEISDENEAAVMYVFVKCVHSQTLLNAYRRSVPLFVTHTGRQTNVIIESTYPFHMNNLQDVRGDSDTSVALNGTVHTTLFKVNGMPYLERFMSSYGMTLDINVLPTPELKDAFPNYSILRHPKLYDDYIYQSILNMENELKRRLDPGNLMKMEFGVLFVDDSTRAVKTTLSMKVIFNITRINGIEVYELTNTRMIFRPVRPGTILGNMQDVNWDDAKEFIAQIATALYSDNGTLFIPEIISVDTYYADGKEWLSVYFTPHFGHFTRDKIFYGNAEAINEYGNEFYWLMANMGGAVQFIFPSVAQLPDPAVLCYGRVMTDFLNKNMDQLSSLTTCPEIHIRIMAECGGWIYFALVDKTVPHDLTTFLQFSEYYLAEIESEKSKGLEEVLNILVSLFCSADPDSLLNYIPEPMWTDYLKAADGDELIAIIECWEHAVQMEKRSFAKTYYKMRDAILDIIRKGNALADETLRNASMDPEIFNVTSPSTKVQTVEQLYSPFEPIPPVENAAAPMNIFKKLFGKDKKQP